MRTFLIIAVVGFFAVGVYGCQDDARKRDSAKLDEDVTRRIERDLNRELERAEEQIGDLRERIEDQFEDRVSEEDLENISREIEESVSSGMARLGKVLGEIGERIQEDSEVKVVDFREFRDLLPSEIEGMKRVDSDGENKNAFGMRYSKFKAEYEGDDIEMEVKILDLGTMKGLAAMGFNYADRAIDQEGSDGFKRTRKFGGFPGYEAAEYDDDEVEMQGVVIIDNRFVVILNIEGEDVDKDIIDDIFDDFPFRRLRRLAQ